MLVTLICLYLGIIKLRAYIIIMLSCKITQVLLTGVFEMKQVFSVKKINTERDSMSCLNSLTSFYWKAPL